MPELEVKAARTAMIDTGEVGEMGLAPKAASTEPASILGADEDDRERLAVGTPSENEETHVRLATR